MVNTLVPDLWTSTAVEEAIFIRNPPLPVKPERKVPEELFNWKRFAPWDAEALITNPLEPSPAVVIVVVAVMDKPEPEVEESKTYLFVPDPF